VFRPSVGLSILIDVTTIHNYNKDYRVSRSRFAGELAKRQQ